MTALGQHDIEMPVAVKVANAGVGGSFRNRLQRYDLKPTKAAGPRRFPLRRPTQRPQSPSMKGRQPRGPECSEDKCAIEKGVLHVTCICLPHPAFAGVRPAISSR